jgi:hypothetical protein
MNIGIPRVFGAAVDGISVCFELKIDISAFMGTSMPHRVPIIPRRLQDDFIIFIGADFVFSGINGPAPAVDTDEISAS